MFKDMIKWYPINFLYILLVLLTIITGCASREKLLREIDQHYGFGSHYLEGGDFALAQEEFEKIKTIAPNNDRAYFGLGLTYYFQGKYGLALRSYQKAIEINPREPEYYNNMAAVLCKLGRWDDVIQYCKVALDNPGYSTPGFAYYNMGCAYLNLGKPQDAVEFFKKSLIQSPTYIEPRLQLGKALFRLGDFQGAIKSLKEAKDLNTDSSSDSLSLGAEIEYFLGQSYLGLGDVSSAKNAFTSVIEGSPGSFWAEESLKFLQNMH
ncbi:MAG: tetratricopeptide repeat protein [bacterium]